MSLELQAFKNVDFGWVRPLESIWSDAETTAEGPNEAVVDEIVADLTRVEKMADPPGRVLLGQAGIGKTHLVGTLRRKTWEAGGWFVLLDVIGITDFWRSAALSFITSLMQEMPDGRRQHEAVLGGVARRFKVEKEVKIAFDSSTIDPRKVVDLLVGGLMRVDPANALNHRDVFRALALLRSHDISAVGVAHSWLQGYDADEQARVALGFQSSPPTAVELVRGMSWVMSLSGPIMVAVDQIDGVVNPSAMPGANGLEASSEIPDFGRMLASGLLDLCTVLRRSLVVVACLLVSWEVIKSALVAFEHRFAVPVPLKPMAQTAAVKALIAGRLAPGYAKAAYKPPKDTWPFTEGAISSAVGATPRTILMRCDAFRRRCVERGEIEECGVLFEPTSPLLPPISLPQDGFAHALGVGRDCADIAGLFDTKDDGKIRRLLREVFDLYAKQIEPCEDYDVVSRGDQAQRTPPLHGRLTFTFHKENDRERHYCFRALEHENAIAFQARLRAALTASGISNKIADRHLLILRRAPIPSGTKTKQLVDAFLKAEGRIIDASDDDLRIFVALRAMHEDAVAKAELDPFEAWLRRATPLCETTFFKNAGLCPPSVVPAVIKATSISAKPRFTEGDTIRTAVEAATRDVLADPPSCASTAARPIKATAPSPASIPVGHRLTSDAEAVLLPTNLLSRHTAIIAGAGSGKTVLLRRIVEEAALAGIPAIVLDPNNDLSRLGDGWPARPANFTDEDDAKARRYFETVEVVVWTPGIHAGNPLFLSVLPDFAAIGEVPDERAQAVGMAADTLGPLANAKTNLQKGVLADALRYFAGKGGGDLKDMTTLLADLPEEVSEIGKADQLAAKMADELLAAVATNPLLKAAGAILDPNLLFAGKDPAKTRVSVVNLSGLASDTAKEDFVNRLQMTLFGWIKKHPSPKGRLYVLDEAQTFMPSGQSALSKTSGVQLVAQARKYGLGMVAATQAPKGIDNKVVSNCTTQFLGKQNAPATIEAAKDLIAASGGKADDLGKLNTGQFYFKTEKSGKPFKVATPICLSWHPQNPPTPEEVVERARRSAP